MAAEVQTRTGRCSTHGTVQATREIPKVGFPPVFTMVARMIAQRRPYTCPECGETVETD
jgi:hypothetical protein